MKKRLISLLLTVVMLLSLVVVPANAALVSGTGTLTITPKVISVKGSTSAPAEVIYTIKVTPPAGGPVGEFHFNLKAPDGMTLSEVKLKPQPANKGGDGYWLNMNDLWYNPTTEEGIFETFEYTPASKYFQAFGTSASRNMTAEAEIMTIKATIAAGKVGDFTLTAENVGINKDGTDSYSVDIKTTPVTVVEALTGDLPVDITPPVKGGMPETTITGTNYTGSIDWVPAVAGGKFAASTPYTANVTLTANTGYQFASDVNPIVAGSDSVTGVTVKDSGSKLEFNAAFAKTGDKDNPVIDTIPTASAIEYGKTLYNSSLNGGEAKVGSATVAGKFTWKDSSIKPEVKDSNSTEYEVVFTPTDTESYESVTCKVKLTINKKKLENLATSPIEPQHYTANPITPTFNVMNGKDFYEILSPSDYTVKFTNNTNVGTANYTIEQTTTGNYDFNTSYGTFEIKAANGSITITGEPSKEYDGNAVTDPSTTTVPTSGTVTFTYYIDEDCTTKTTTANGAASEGAAPARAGDYWVKAELAATTNYNAAISNAKKFTIEKKNLIITAEPKTITYGEAPANAGVTYDGFVSGESESTLTGSLSYDYDYTQYGDVGDNYTITPKGVSNSNYDISFVPGKLTVGKKELTNINTSGVSVTKVYDGTTAAGTLSGSISFTGEVGTDDVSITAVPRAYADANVSSTKTVTLDLSLAGAKKDNYKINSTTADISNAKITAYTAVTDKTEKGTSSARIDVLKSSGEFPKVDIDGVGTEKATGTITYSYDSVTYDTWEGVVNALKTADANTDANIQYTFTGNGNYAGASITDTIYVKVTDLGFYLRGTSTKADASNGADVAADTTYGKKWSELVSLKNLEAKVGATPIAGTFSIVGGDNMPAAGNQTYTVVFTSTDGTYANQTVFTGNVNVAQREVEIKWENAAGRVYGDGKTVTATITNKVEPDDVSLTVADGDKTNADDYIATASLTGTASANYKLPAVFTQPYTIKKATPTGEPSYTKITAAGKTLQDAALKIGTINKPGTIKWVEVDGTTVLPDTTPVAKNKAYNWLFTPADTANYNTLTGSLTPYYVASSGGSHVSKVQKPEITIIGSGKADLSADGRTATITAAAGHELVSVVLNGKEMGKVEKLTGLKTGDKATITFRAKTDGKAEMDKIIAQKASKLTLMARSKKTAKLNIKVVVKGDLKAITDAGYTVKYKFYRSTKKSAGYKAVLTKKAPSYVNTYGKKGTMYYYKARVMIYDKNGNFVAQTALKQCKYANRLWTK